MQESGGRGRETNLSGGRGPETNLEERQKKFFFFFFLGFPQENSHEVLFYLNNSQ
jgi:hypothetical protein